MRHRPDAAFRAARRSGAALTAAVALLAPVSTQAAPGDQQFVTIVSHDPSGFLKALRAGEDFVKGGGGRQFRIVLAGAGVIVAIPGTSTAQRELMRSPRGGGLEIIACKETIDALSQANKRRVPVVPGVSVQACRSLRNKMTVAGWQIPPGF